MNEVSVTVPCLFLVDGSEFAYVYMSSKHIFELKLVLFIKKIECKTVMKMEILTIG